MKLKIINIVFFLALYIPFEVTVLKLLPLSNWVFSISRFVPEIIFYILFIYIFCSKLISRKPFAKSSINTPIIIFLVYTFLLIIINRAPIVDSLVGLRSIFRYVVLFYIIINLNVSYKKVKWFLNSMVIIAVVQSFISIYHHFFGISNFWLPKANVLQIGSNTYNFKSLVQQGTFGSRELGVGIGTFGDSIFLAVFLIIVSAIIIPYGFNQFKSLFKYTKFVWPTILIILIGILATYSRGSVIIFIMLIILVFIYTKDSKFLVFYSGLAIVLLIPLLIYVNDNVYDDRKAYLNPGYNYTNPIANVGAIFLPDYREKSFNYSRGYTLQTIGGGLIKSIKIFGNSPATEFAIRKAIKKNFQFIHFNNIYVINDVYWVAFIIYYGILGLLIFIYILYKLYMASILVYKKSDKLVYKALGLSCALLILSSIPYTFIIRTFVFKHYSLYFWLLTALVVLEWQRIIEFPKNNKTLGVSSNK